MGEDPVECRVVGLGRRADQALERRLRDADVQTEDARPGELGRSALVMLVGRDDRRVVRPVLLVEREERRAHRVRYDGFGKAVEDDLRDRLRSGSGRQPF
jgi:YD repeat-containing protein